MKFPALLLALLLAVAARADIQFNGVVVDSAGKVKVSLINTDTGDYHWVAINGKFGGYTVTQYTAGRPANPAKPGDTAVRDRIVLRIGDRPPQTILLNDAQLLATPVSNVASFSNTQTNAMDALNTQLQ